MRFPSRDSQGSAGQLMDVLEQAMREMGTELHDDLIQKLSVIRLHLDKIERSEFAPDQTREIVARMQQDFGSVVNAVRRISKRLSPDRVEGQSFSKTLEILLANMDVPGATKVGIESNGVEKRLDNRTEMFLLRIVQELAHNSSRHTAAWYIWIRIFWSSNQLVIEVEDDGTGIGRVEEFIDSLSKKCNTVKLRADAIGAMVQYLPGASGLLARIVLRL